MKEENVIKITENTFKDIMEIFKTKGKTYANNSTDQLDNFKRLGKTLNLDPCIPLMVYTTKHWDSLNHFISCLTNGIKQEDPEHIFGRINDIILYLILLKGLLIEEHNIQDE